MLISQRVYQTCQKKKKRDWESRPKLFNLIYVIYNKKVLKERNKIMYCHSLIITFDLDFSWLKSKEIAI